MTREEAIKEIEKAFEPAFANYIITALTEGATASDKEQESRKGKWTKLSDVIPCMNCPICGSTFTLILGGDKMHYCPNCGTDMKEE